MALIYLSQLPEFRFLPIIIIIFNYKMIWSLSRSFPIKIISEQDQALIWVDYIWGASYSLRFTQVIVQRKWKFCKICIERHTSLHIQFLNKRKQEWKKKQNVFATKTLFLNRMALCVNLSENPWKCTRTFMKFSLYNTLYHVLFFYPVMVSEMIQGALG